MPLASVSYPGNGATLDWPVPFGYISRDHVTATINGVGTSFTWMSPTTIRISPAVPNGSTVGIRRTTPKTPLVDFADGNNMFEVPLDTLALQVVYLSQEQQDAVDSLVLGGVTSLAGTSVTVAPSGNLASTNAQAALYELDAEKAALSGAAFTGNISTTGGITAAGNISATGFVIGNAVQGNSIIIPAHPTGQITVTERGGGAAFQLYAQTGAYRIYSGTQARDVLTLDHNGNLNAIGATPSAHGLRDNNERVFSRTSCVRLGPFAPVTNGAVSAAHGRGRVPRWVKAVLVCDTADRGYSAGVELEFPTYEYSGQGSITIEKDATNVRLNIAGTIALADRGGGGGGPIINGRWSIFFDVWD